MELKNATDSNDEPRARRFTWTAFGFLFAFMLTIVTVILTGLYVKAPGSHRQNATVATETVEADGAEQRAE